MQIDPVEIHVVVKSAANPWQFGVTVTHVAIKTVLDMTVDIDKVGPLHHLGVIYKNVDEIIPMVLILRPPQVEQNIEAGPELVAGLTTTSVHGAALDKWQTSHSVP